MAKGAATTDAPKGDEDLQRLKRYVTESETLTQDARTKSLLALDYYDSDQYTRKELAALAARGQPPIVANRLKVAINGIVGVTEKGRSDPRCWPRNPGDDDSADAATDVLRYISDFNRFKRIKQACFRDMLVPGSAAVLVGVDDDKQVTITQVRWEEFLYDPRSRREDFKDARWLGIAKWMYADDAAALYPGKGDRMDAAIDTSGSGSMLMDEATQDRPLAGMGFSGAWVDKKQRRLMVVEMYLRDNGWKRACFTASDVLEYGPSPYLDHKGRPDCPIEGMSAYVKRNNDRYGAAWDMMGVQDEINKRRSKALHLMSVSRIETKDPSAIDVDADVARKEAARPDGVLPYGWVMSPNTAEVRGNLELLQEAKGELERMGPNPALAGRSDDSSGRHLLARQMSGMVELANLYGALEDWELRVYRQAWGRAKQFWTAPQFIRVTDDENAPKFVGLNQPKGQPMQGPDGQMVEGPPVMQGGKSVLGYKNVVAEMDIDIEIDAQADVGNIASEIFSEIIELVKISPDYQQQMPLKQLLQLSPIPHKRSVLEAIDQAAQAQQQAAAQQQQIAQAAEMAKVGETQARTQLHGAKAQEAGATGFAKVTDALTYAHSAHGDHIAAGLAAGIQHEQTRQAFTDSQHAQQQDQEHDANMQASDQQASADSQQSAQDAAAEQQQNALEAQQNKPAASGS